MVHLISRGFVIPILRYISNISKSERIDASLIRHFVVEVLDIIQSPYSDDLKEILYPLVQGKIFGNTICSNFILAKICIRLRVLVRSLAIALTTHIALSL